jgi:hypothetical protein
MRDKPACNGPFEPKQFTDVRCAVFATAAHCWHVLREEIVCEANCLFASEDCIRKLPRNRIGLSRSALRPKLSCWPLNRPLTYIDFDRIVRDLRDYGCKIFQASKISYVSVRQATTRETVETRFESRECAVNHTTYHRLSPLRPSLGLPCTTTATECPRSNSPD